MPSYAGGPSTELGLRGEEDCDDVRLRKFSASHHRSLVGPAACLTRANVHLGIVTRIV